MKFYLLVEGRRMPDVGHVNVYLYGRGTVILAIR